MFSPRAEEPTMDQRAGLLQNSAARDDQLLGSDSGDAPNCVPEKELCLSQLSSAHDREYAKGTSSSGTDPPLDVNVDSSIIRQRTRQFPTKTLQVRPNLHPINASQEDPNVSAATNAMAVEEVRSGKRRVLRFSLTFFSRLLAKKLSCSSRKQFLSSAACSITLKSLEQVASNLTAGRIMQRHLLVELVEHRIQLEDKYKPENYRRAKMIREDKRRLERSDGLALDEMIREAYPTVIKGSDEYNKSRTTLRNNLSSGRNPHTLAHEFGRHILDLIPVGEGLGKSSITDNQVRHDDFKLFISVLKEKRGRFLRQCASCLDSFFDVSDDNSNCNRRYLLEDVDESSVTAERYDSSGLVDMLEMVVDDQRG
ncbi:hypothetical protein AFUB_075390 [Aspergillus fumigatus A1163]|uniref:Uncharacterized protein n=1 Tax=Aspergillus fumigatus (strain CBS 144.89 / FGSC A1163 / CEA10) TaxID=451804 RepID=B0Y7X9_ASPFC|nr:hypothetical protein AFUB_075390 [Aspergillus fumigatus A1163]